jgi:4-carboxymuconolactone decarboxylase
LDPKTRALRTVAMLAATGNQLQLGVYVQAALRTGADEEQIREVLRQVAVYAGFPAAWNALLTANKAFSRAPQRQPSQESPQRT